MSTGLRGNTEREKNRLRFSSTDPKKATTFSFSLASKASKKLGKMVQEKAEISANDLVDKLSDKQKKTLKWYADSKWGFPGTAIGYAVLMTLLVGWSGRSFFSRYSILGLVLFIIFLIVAILVAVTKTAPAAAAEDPTKAAGAADAGKGGTA